MLILLKPVFVQLIPTPQLYVLR